jgi:hypothetical protein
MYYDPLATTALMKVMQAAMDNRKASSAHSVLWLALQKLARGTGVQREDLLEALAGELGELRRCWGVNLKPSADTDRGRALELARRTVVTNLDIHIRALKPPKLVPPRRYVHTVLVSFNIQVDTMHGNLKESDLSARRDWLARDAPAALRVSIRTSARYLEDAIGQIEQQILDSGYELQVASEPVDSDEAEEPIDTTSTSALPLDPTLVDLLQAQIDAANNLPYWPYDPDLPPLVQIYVDRTVRPAKSRLDIPAKDAREAYRLHRHLTISGVAGSGKSTLAIQQVAQHCKDILDGNDDSGLDRAWLPLYLPARLMSAAGGLTDVLRTALNHHLAGYLASSLEATLFSEAPPGHSGWLVFIDGLDEILGVDDRNRLLSYLDRHLDEPIYRFVLLSRVFTERQLAKLSEGSSKTPRDFGIYDLMPLNILNCGGYRRV